MRNLREDADFIIRESISAVLPDTAVEKTLSGLEFGNGRLLLVSVGKAGWQMANAAKQYLGARLNEGIVITKYGHNKGVIEGISVFEAGHPVPDEQSIIGTEAVLSLTQNLAPSDTVLFLLSGGASALFEQPLIRLGELVCLTKQLLACGADIVEMNTIRKRLSSVKGGKFAIHCAPANVISIILSDVVGDSADMIASGPTYPDTSTAEQAMEIVRKYQLQLPDYLLAILQKDTVSSITNAEYFVTGSVQELCRAAAQAAQTLGYRTELLSDCVTCQAREAGSLMGSIAKFRAKQNEKIAVIFGGETVVYLKGSGKGGRNQELALAAAEQIRGLKNAAIFSLGSDGTDGPTDAAGGFVDGNTADLLQEQGVSIFETLEQNDAYHALQRCDGLIITGATGTNVNDVVVCLIDIP